MEGHVMWVQICKAFIVSLTVKCVLAYLFPEQMKKKIDYFSSFLSLLCCPPVPLLYNCVLQLRQMTVLFVTPAAVDFGCSEVT